MSSINSSSSTSSQAEAAPEWQVFLDERSERHIDIDEDTDVVANLGRLLMLDERDAFERAEREARGETFDQLPKNWVLSWVSGGLAGLTEWMKTHEAARKDWPFRSRELRRSIYINEGYREHVVERAADFLSRHAGDHPPTFTKWFLPGWQLLLHESRKPDDSHSFGEHGGDVSEKLEAAIGQLLDPGADESGLFVSGGQSRLFLNLVRSLSQLSQRFPKERSTEFTRHGIRLGGRDWRSHSFDVTTMLCWGIEEPLGRELLESESGQGFDWAFAVPALRSDFVSIQKDVPVPSRRVGEVTLQRVSRSLKTGGRALFLMPRSFCSGIGTEAKVRKWLLENWRVDAVLDIPDHLGFEGSKEPTSLFFVRAVPPGRAVFLASEATMGNCLEADESRTDSKLSMLCNTVRAIAGLPKAQRFETLSNNGQPSETVGISEPQSDVDAELLGLAAVAAEGHGEPIASPDSALSKQQTGFVPIAQIAMDRFRFTWKTPSSGQSSLFIALSALAASQPEIRVGKLSDIAEVNRGIVYDRKLAKLVKDLKDDEKPGVRLLRVADLSRKKAGFLAILNPRLPDLVLPGKLEKRWKESKRRVTAKFLSVFRELSVTCNGREIKASAVLSNNDVLISRVGTIGRINIYRPDILGDSPEIVATSNVGIATPGEGTAAEFLAGLLASELYQQHLATLTIGSTIKYLRIEDLRGVPVPIAPKHLQSAITEHLLGGHDLELLPQVLASGPRGDATVRFLLENETVRAFCRKAHLAEGDADLPLEPVVDAIQEWLHEAPAGQLTGWWEETSALVEDLHSVITLPDNRDRFAALQGWLARFLAEHQKLVSALTTIKFSEGGFTLETDRLVLETVRKLAKEFLAELQSRAQAESARLLEATEVMATLAPVSISLDVSTVLTATLTNRGALSLRDMEVNFLDARGKASLLLPGASIDVPATLQAQELGSLPLSVDWTARRIDGHPVKGRVELGVEVVPQGAAAKTDDLGTNPYVDARTLKAEEDRVFFGRRREIERILAELRKASASTVLLMEGNRRTGKTSLVDHFMRRYLPENWVAAYCTFQSGEGVTESTVEASGKGVPTREVFFILAKAVVEAVVASGVKVELEGIGTFDPEWRSIVLFRRTSSMLRPCFESGPPYEQFRIVLEQCLEAMAPRRLLLVIDEFDRLQEGIDSGVTSTQVPENIRHLFQTYNQMAGILTGSRKIRRLREEYWNVLFGIGDPIILRGLEPNAIHDLITKPVAGRITYAPPAVGLIAHLTAGQPRIVQTLCSRLFDLCEQRDTRLVTEAMVEEVAAEKARDYEHFKVLWSAIQSSVHQFVALTINRVEQAGTSRITYALLQDELAASGLTMTQEDLEASLANLTDLEVVGERIAESTKHYFIEIPLLARWLLQNQDNEKLRETAINETQLLS